MGQTKSSKPVGMNVKRWFAHPASRLLFIITLLTVVVSATFALNLFPVMRGPGEWPPDWRWAYRPYRLITWRLVFPLLISGAIILYIRRRGTLLARQALVVGLLAFALQLAVSTLVYEHVYAPLVRTTEYDFYGYFLPAVDVKDLPAYIDQYGNKQTQFPVPEGIRLRTHPPGFVIFYWGVIRFSEAVSPLSDLAARALRGFNLGWPNYLGLTNAEGVAAALSGTLIALASALAVIPMFVLSRDVAEEDSLLSKPALYLWPFVVSATLFTAIPDQLLTIFTALCMLFVYRAANRPDIKWSVIAGVLWSLGSLLTVGFFVVLAFMGLVFALELLRLSKVDKRALISLIISGVSLLVGAVLVWLIMDILWGFDPIVVFQNSLTSHQQDWTAHRSYLTWVFYNPYELLVYAGIPVTVLFLEECRVLTNRLITGQPLSSGDRLTVAAVVTILLLVTSGVVRGEIARLWLFLVPFIVWGAARTAARVKMNDRQLTALAGLQLLQMITFQAFIWLFW